MVNYKTEGAASKKHDLANQRAFFANLPGFGQFEVVCETEYDPNHGKYGASPSTPYPTAHALMDDDVDTEKHVFDNYTVELMDQELEEKYKELLVGKNWQEQVSHEHDVLFLKTENVVRTIEAIDRDLGRRQSNILFKGSSTDGIPEIDLDELSQVKDYSLFSRNLSEPANISDITLNEIEEFNRKADRYEIFEGSSREEALTDLEQDPDIELLKKQARKETYLSIDGLREEVVIPAKVEIDGELILSSKDYRMIKEDRNTEREKELEKIPITSENPSP